MVGVGLYFAFVMVGGRTRPVRSLSDEQWWRLVAGVEGVPFSGGAVAPVLEPCWPSRGDALRVRDCGLVWVAGHCGLRVGELVGLRWGDVAEPGGPRLEVVVRSEVAKRGFARRIPLEDGVRAAIARLWRVLALRCRVGLEMPVFGVGTDWHRMSCRRVQQVVRRFGWQHLGELIHPHTLRHTFAARLRRHCDLAVVQVLLGHRRLSSTQLYMNVRRDELREAVEWLGRG